LRSNSSTNCKTSVIVIEPKHDIRLNYYKPICHGKNKDFQGFFLRSQIIPKLKSQKNKGFQGFSLIIFNAQAEKTKGFCIVKIGFRTYRYRTIKAKFVNAAI
jgi:hypothetical protein